MTTEVGPAKERLLKHHKRLTVSDAPSARPANRPVKNQARQADVGHKGSHQEDEGELEVVEEVGELEVVGGGVVVGVMLGERWGSRSFKISFTKANLIPSSGTGLCQGAEVGG